MGEFIRKHLGFLVFAVIGLSCFVLMGYLHEQVHIQIYKSYGIESHIEWFSHFPHIVTVADSSCPTEFCILAHNINEAVGYTANGFFIMVYFGILFLLLKKELRRVKVE